MGACSYFLPPGLTSPHASLTCSATPCASAAPPPLSPHTSVACASSSTSRKPYLCFRRLRPCSKSSRLCVCVCVCVCVRARARACGATRPTVWEPQPYSPPFHLQVCKIAIHAEQAVCDHHLSAPVRHGGRVGPCRPCLQEQLLKVRQVVVPVHKQPVGASAPATAHCQPGPIHNGGVVQLVGENVHATAGAQRGHHRHVGRIACIGPGGMFELRDLHSIGWPRPQCSAVPSHPWGRAGSPGCL
jgi:hypothetical protein